MLRAGSCGPHGFGHPTRPRQPVETTSYRDHPTPIPLAFRDSLLGHVGPRDLTRRVKMEVAGVLPGLTSKDRVNLRLLLLKAAFSEGEVPRMPGLGCQGCNLLTFTPVSGDFVQPTRLPGIQNGDTNAKCAWRLTYCIR